MSKGDNADFGAAFAIGTLLGVGAALLLRPSRPDPRKQLHKGLRPHARPSRRRAVRSAAAAPPAESRGAASDEVISAGRELLSEFRAEVRRILDEARDELREIAEEGASGGRRREMDPELED